MLLGVTSLGLGGCEEIVDFSGRPIEKLQTGTAEAANSAILVAESLPAEGIDEGFRALVPDEILRIVKRVRKARCRSSEGEEVCRAAIVKGAVLRDGEPTLVGTARGLMASIPLRAELVAELGGDKSAAPQQITQRFELLADYAVSFADDWTLGVALEKELRWSDAAELRVFDTKVAIGPDILDEMQPHLRRFAGRLSEALQPRKLPALTAEAWRALHAPFQIASGPDIWLSGEPREIRFGGIAFQGGKLDVRAAIGTRLRTFIDVRPKPLWPGEQPAPNPAPTKAIGGIVLPIDIGYEDLRAELRPRLMRGLKVPAVVGETVPEVSVKDVTLYPVGTRLGIGLDMIVRIPGLWRRLRGHAHFLATPNVEPGGSRLILSRAELIDPSVIPDQYRRYLAPLTRREFADEIAAALSFDLGKPLEQAMLLLNAAADRPIGDGLRLKGRLVDWRVGTIETTRNGLRLNTEFIGDLAIREDLGAVSAEAAAKPASSAQP